MTVAVYRGPAAVIEEATTELAARKAFSELTPGLRRNRGDLETGFQSYENYITRLEGILDRRAGVKGLKARQALVDARAKGLMGDGDDLTTVSEYLRAFTDGLDVTAEQRREILVDLWELEAEHLPPNLR